MLTYYVHGNERRGIFEDGPDNDAKLRNIKAKKIDNKIILIAGTTGSGKSTFLESLVYEFWKKNYTVVFITEKVGFEFESAFAMFPVEAQYHLDILNNEMKLKPFSKEKCKNLVKLYHPFTFNIPKDKLPPINFFTFSLKNLKESSLISILYGGIDAGADTMAIRNSLSLLNGLKETDDMSDFILKSQESINNDKDDELSYDPDKSLLPIKMAGDSKTLNKIHDGIFPFRKDYMLQPHKFKYNINMIKLLKDNRHFHVFSTKWIKESRLKFFTYVTLLEEIRNAIASDKVNNQILVVYEEIKFLLPVTTEISYEKELAKIIGKINTSLRMAGSILSTTQDYYRTNKDFRTGCNEQFLFKLSQEDMQTFQRGALLKQSQIDILGSLNRGQYISLNDFRKFKLTKHLSNVPPYAHTEQGEKFIDKFNKVYPEDLKDYSELKLEMLNIRNKSEEKIGKHLEKLKERAKKEEEKKQERANRIPNQTKEIIDKMKAEDLNDLKKYCYEQRKPDLLGNVKSFREIGRSAKVKLTHHTAKRYALEWAIQVKDNDYLKDAKNV